MALSTKIRSIPSDLISFREKHNLSQKALGQELGVNRITIWRWETGRSRIPSIMPVTLRGLQHIFQSRKSAKRRADRIKATKEFEKERKREKALKKLPVHIRSHFDSNG